jgi:outer membrane receptor protein involved in Fe transport
MAVISVLRAAGQIAAGVCGLAAALSLGSVAFAQQPPALAAASTSGPLTVEEVTVTGSRIKRSSDFDSPNPTTVIDSSFMENLGIVNVAEAIAQLPANVSTNTPATTGNSGFFIGSTIANLRGLNPYFGSRTLTLVNNRRFVPTNQGDGVDLNFIPSILIDRVDVVTGGASAAYGSGAIAGVENIFLNTKLEGIKLDGDYYQSSKSDARNAHIGGAIGHSLFGDRGHFVIGGEFQKQDALGCENVRSWCHQNVNLYQNTVPNTASLNNPNGGPAYLLGSNIRNNQIGYNGVFGAANANATSTLQATPDGQGTMPFTLGPQPYAGFGYPRQRNSPGGDGYPVYQFVNLLAPVTRGVLTGTFNFAITDSLNLTADASYGKVTTTNFASGATDTAELITNQNAFIQGSPSLTAAVGPFAYLNKNWTPQTDSFTQFTTKVKRFSVGVDGKIGSSSWSWDAYYQYGQTSREQFVNDNRHYYQYFMAIDTVMVNGQPQCRVTAAGSVAAAAAQYKLATGGPVNGKTAPYAGLAGTADGATLAAGCQPLNPFGQQPMSAAAHNYAFGTLDEQLVYTQQVAALNASGDLFSGIGAGPWSAATGLEFRPELGHNNELTNIPDAVRRDFLTQYGEAFSGKVTVWEGYVEANTPLLKDKPFAKELTLDFAARESRYDNQGLAGTSGQEFKHNLTTFKISGNWDPTDWLRFRGSESRDARAANFRELYYGQYIGAGGSFGYCPAGNFADPCAYNLHGNVNLQPEKSDTTTIGIVLTPKALLPGFQFAADYFKIHIRDAIEQASVPNTLSDCRKGVQSACDLMTFYPGTGGQLAFQTPNPVTGLPTNNVESVTALAFNGAGYIQKGIDFTANYLLAFKDSTLNTRILATRTMVQDIQTAPNGPFVNVVGETGSSQSFVSDYQPAPRWTANMTSTYSTGPWSATGQMRWVSQGIIDHLGVTPGQPNYLKAVDANGTVLHQMATNHVGNYFVFNASGSYSFENIPGVKLFQLFASLDNVFNRKPPFVPGITGFGINNNSQGGTNAVYYDTIGLAYRVGFRANF